MATDQEVAMMVKGVHERYANIVATAVNEAASKDLLIQSLQVELSKVNEENANLKRVIDGLAIEGANNDHSLQKVGRETQAPSEETWETRQARRAQQELSDKKTS